MKRLIAKLDLTFNLVSSFFNAISAFHRILSGNQLEELPGNIFANLSKLLNM